MANKLRSTNLERFLRWIKSPMDLIVPIWPNWQLLNPNNFTKKDHR